MKVLVSNPQIELAEKLFSSDEQVVVHLALRQDKRLTVIIRP